MPIKDIKRLNFTMLYGVVKKIKKNGFVINYGLGKIKINTNSIDGWKIIKKDYTVTVSGFIMKKRFKTILCADQISIFDTKPHYYGRD